MHFTAYRTFDWGEADIEVKNPVYESSLINKNIRHTVEEEFAKRGIVSGQGQSGLYRQLSFVHRGKAAVFAGSLLSLCLLSHPFLPVLYGWGRPHGYGPTHAEQYTEGTLIIDITTDAKSDELLWRGTVSGRVDDVENLQNQIAKGVRAIKNIR